MGNCSCFRLRKGKKSSDGKGKNRNDQSPYNVEMIIESSAKDHSISDNKAKIFSFRELATCTKNFKSESLIGEGGFGSVYKGQLEKTGQVIAVKRLEDTGVQGEKEFLVEILMLSLLHHSNLVNMIGYCAEGNQRLLVYEYMPLGSLEDHLHDLPPDKKPLDWNTRIMIAAGAAKGLNYLHCQADPPVIYRDLKSSNILLGEDFHPKLSDFGLAKFGPGGDKSHVSTRVMGTHGYCAPEYASSGKLTMKSDIYTFGVVLLELITGCKPLDESRGHAKRFLVDWARPMMKDDNNILQLADPHLGGQFSESIFKKMVEVATMCLQENVHTRPSSSQLVDALHYLVTKQSELNKAAKSSEKGGSTPKKEQRPDKIDISTSNKDTLRVLNKELDRHRAVEEAKMWGASWREKKCPNGLNR